MSECKACFIPVPSHSDRHLLLSAPSSASILSLQRLLGPSISKTCNHDGGMQRSYCIHLRFATFLHLCCYLQFWKSNAMFWCDYCKVWMNDNPATKATHEAGMKHKDMVARSKFPICSASHNTCTDCLVLKHANELSSCLRAYRVTTNAAEAGPS